MFKLAYALRRLARRTWVRCALFCILALSTALAAILLQPIIPESLARTVGADSIDGVLTVIASSMLTVATFSLSIMVSAYASASGSATPRAISLLIEDATATNAVATFVGAFIFSLVGIILLSTGIFQPGGRLVLLGVTVAVIVAVVAMLIRWIDQLSRLGRVHETIDRLEEAAVVALKEDRARPCLGAAPGPDAPAGATTITAEEVGYVQTVDMATLQAIAEECGGAVHLATRPGAFVHHGRPVVVAEASLSEEIAARARAAVVVGPDRSFDQDPRFGVICLSEVASRALSPAVNDPGTAIDVVNTLIRVFSTWDRAEQAEPQPLYPRVSAPALDAGELLDDAFAPIARDGAGMAEVGVRLQKAFDALAQARDPALASNARRHSAAALRRAERALDEGADLDRVRAAIPAAAG